MNIKMVELKQEYVKEICSFFTNKREQLYSFPKLSYPLNIEDLNNSFAKRFDNSIVLYNNDAAGFGNIYDVIKGKECNLGNIVINPKFRNKGIGIFLINELIKIAKIKYEVEIVNLYCWCENSIGLLFYHKIGFNPVDLVEFNIDDERIPVLKYSKQV